MNFSWNYIVPITWNYIVLITWNYIVHITWNYIVHITNSYRIPLKCLPLKRLQIRHLLENIYSCLRAELIKQIKAWKIGCPLLLLNLHVLQSNILVFFSNAPHIGLNLIDKHLRKDHIWSMLTFGTSKSLHYTHSISCKSLIRLKVDISWNHCWLKTKLNWFF